MTLGTIERAPAASKYDIGPDEVPQRGVRGPVQIREAPPDTLLSGENGGRGAQRSCPFQAVWGKVYRNDVSRPQESQPQNHAEAYRARPEYNRLVARPHLPAMDPVERHRQRLRQCRYLEVHALRHRAEGDTGLSSRTSSLSVNAPSLAPLPIGPLGVVGFSATRIPGLMPSTALPVSITTPAASCPRGTGASARWLYACRRRHGGCSPDPNRRYHMRRHASTHRPDPLRVGRPRPAAHRRDHECSVLE